MRELTKGVIRHQLPNLVLIAVATIAVITALALSGCANQVAFGDINAPYYHATRHVRHERISYSAADRAALDRLVERTSTDRPRAKPQPAQPAEEKSWWQFW